MVMYRIIVVCILLCPFFVSAQQLHNNLVEIVEAKIIAIEGVEQRDIHGTDTTVTVQTLQATLLSGSRKGETVSFENELTILDVDDLVYLSYISNLGGDEYFVFKDYKRQSQIMWLFGLFFALLVVFAGRQGVRALFSLGLSLLAIFFILVPALLAGHDPILASLLIAGVVLACVFFITHGINPSSIAAFTGTFAAVIFTSLLAWFWVWSMRLTGFGDDLAVSLNFATNGILDFPGLLLGSIIIGILGVIDDVSITQASVVQQLKRANPTLGMKELYDRAILVGKDHVGSLVNTLAFAYVGVSLPLVLLMANAGSDLYLSINNEIVAAELVRIIVGSIGLIMAVPFTTAAAAWYFSRLEIDAIGDTSSIHEHHNH